MDDQTRQLALLGDPRTYGLPDGTPVVRYDTHGAAVFLAGERAYKLKRAVKFHFMDFSTLELRHAACAAEIAVNRRTAPELYLGIAPVLSRGGALALGQLREPGGAAEPGAVDWVVVLRRFDERMVLDAVADRGQLTAAMIERLAESVAAFHAVAQVRPDHGGMARFAEAIATDIRELRARGPVLDQTITDRLERLMPLALLRHGEIVDRRRREGCVRHCHGDLHLGNVVLLDGRPVPFDGIEFNDRIACIDTLYDLAFLLMDLAFRGHADLANGALNRYLWRSPIDSAADLAGLALMPLYLARRAAIRAHVGAANAAVLHDAKAVAAMTGRARAYHRLAVAVLEPGAPRLVAVGGLSGTGKTTLAMALAPHLGGSAPGAVVLRSDVIRKRLAGVAPTDKLPAGGYGAEASARVYAELARLAGIALDSGYSVVADAVFAHVGERQAIAAIAAARGLRFDGVWLEASLATLKQRVAARRGDASDATPAVIDRQAALAASGGEWHRIDADRAPSTIADSARRLIEIKELAHGHADTA